MPEFQPHRAFRQHPFYFFRPLNEDDVPRVGQDLLEAEHLHISRFFQSVGVRVKNVRKALLAQRLPPHNDERRACGPLLDAEALEKSPHEGRLPRAELAREREDERAAPAAGAALTTAMPRARRRLRPLRERPLREPLPESFGLARRKASKDLHGA